MTLKLKTLPTFSMGPIGPAGPTGPQGTPGTSVVGAITLNITRADIPSVTITEPAVILSGYSLPGDLGVGAIYTSQDANAGSLMAIQDLAGTWFRLVLTSEPAEAGWFGVKADGATDDTAAINAALAGVGVNGGQVIMPSGTMIVSGILYMPSNVYLVGQGPSTVLKLAARYYSVIIFMENVTNVGVRDFTIDCNFLHWGLSDINIAIKCALSTNIFIENINILNIGSAFSLSNTSSTTSLTVGLGTKTLTVDTGLTLPSGAPILIAQNFSSEAMFGTITSYNSGTGTLVVDVTESSGSGTIATWNAIGAPLARGIYLDTCHGHNTVRGNTIVMPYPSGTFNQALYFYSGDGQLRIEDNVFDGSAIFGAQDNTVVTNNTVKNWKFGGGFTCGGSGCVFDSNHAYGGSGIDTNYTAPSGFELTCFDSTFSNNVAHNNSAVGFAVFGQRNTFIGNSAYDNGQIDPSGINTAGFVLLDIGGINNANYSRFVGNASFNTNGAAGSQAWGISIAYTTIGVSIVGNNFGSNRIGDKYFTGPDSPSVGLESGMALQSSVPIVLTGDHVLYGTDCSLIFNAAATSTLDLQDASQWTGRWLYIKTIANEAVVSGGNNVLSLDGTTFGTAILPATAGKWAALQSNGSYWIIMMAN